MICKRIGACKSCRAYAAKWFWEIRIMYYLFAFLAAYVCIFLYTCWWFVELLVKQFQSHLFIYNIIYTLKPLQLKHSFFRTMLKQKWGFHLRYWIIRFKRWREKIQSNPRAERNFPITQYDAERHPATGGRKIKIKLIITVRLTTPERGSVQKTTPGRRSAGLL